MHRIGATQPFPIHYTYPATLHNTWTAGNGIGVLANHELCCWRAPTIPITVQILCFPSPFQLLVLLLPSHCCCCRNSGCCAPASAIMACTAVPAQLSPALLSQTCCCRCCEAPSAWLTPQGPVTTTAFAHSPRTCWLSPPPPLAALLLYHPQALTCCIPFKLYPPMPCMLDSSSQ